MSKPPSKRSHGSPEERAFLEQYDASAFDRPSLAVDVVLLTAAEGALRVLLVKRHEHPARGMWSLPGGFTNIDESLDSAAEFVRRTSSRARSTCRSRAGTAAWV